MERKSLNMNLPKPAASTIQIKQLINPQDTSNISPR